MRPDCDCGGFLFCRYGRLYKTWAWLRSRVTGEDEVRKDSGKETV
jgi:hypothetical protein